MWFFSYSAVCAIRSHFWTIWGSGVGVDLINTGWNEELKGFQLFSTSGCSSSSRSGCGSRCRSSGWSSSDSSWRCSWWQSRWSGRGRWDDLNAYNFLAFWGDLPDYFGNKLHLVNRPADMLFHLGRIPLDMLKTVKIIVSLTYVLLHLDFGRSAQAQVGRGWRWRGRTFTVIFPRVSYPFMFPKCS